MLTRARWTTRRSLFLGAVAGIAAAASFPAAAEQAAVRGADVAAAQETEDARHQAELKEHLEALNEQLKQQLNESLRNQPAANVKLALAELSSRG